MSVPGFRCVSWAPTHSARKRDPRELCCVSFSYPSFSWGQLELHRISVWIKFYNTPGPMPMLQFAFLKKKVILKIFLLLRAGSWWYLCDWESASNTKWRLDTCLNKFESLGDIFRTEQLSSLNLSNVISFLLTPPLRIFYVAWSQCWFCLLGLSAAHLCCLQNGLQWGQPRAFWMKETPGSFKVILQAESKDNI